MIARHTRLLAAVCAAMFAVAPAVRVHAAGFIFAGDADGVSIITHVEGYTGSGGNRVITVGIDPSSLHAAQMVIPVQNVIRTINALEVTTGNLEAANVPFSQWDFESVALHEMGHAMGLSHCNLATESGLPAADRDYTKATDGDGDGNSNEPAQFNLNAGGDGIKGSGDDVRGNDKNLNWFRKGINDPGAPLPAVVDSTTYGRLLADLPPGDTFIANGEELIMDANGYPDTEAVMQQGTPNGQAQRTMVADDIGALRMAMSGVDRLQGTGDDYTFTLTYAGLTTNADIVIDFDNSRTGFATTYTSGIFLNANHVGLTRPINVYFNNNAVAWFFNNVSNESEPEPEPDPGDPDNVFVDFAVSENGTGAETFPFDNVTDAVAFANSDAVINLEPGATGETFMGGFSITKPLTLLNNDPGSGTVQIGN